MLARGRGTEKGDESRLRKSEVGGRIPVLKIPGRALIYRRRQVVELDTLMTDQGPEDFPLFEDCPSCQEPLPQQARVRFCPFCGVNVQRVLCPSCGEKLKLDWQFCIACGTPVESETGS